MGDHAEAERLFELGDEHSTEGARALHEGSTEAGHELFRQAVSAYRAALTAAPEDDLFLRSNLLLCIGAREFGLGEIESAVSRYDEVIAALAGQVEGEGVELLAQARLNRADYLLSLGSTDEARLVVTEVLAKYPEHGYALYLKDRCAPAAEE